MASGAVFSFLGRVQADDVDFHLSVLEVSLLDLLEECLLVLLSPFLGLLASQSELGCPALILLHQFEFALHFLEFARFLLPLLASLGRLLLDLDALL